MVEMAGVRVEVETDPKKLRPSDEPLIVGDNRKIRRECGWRPEIPLSKTLEDVLEWWRGRYGVRGG
jgi:GDP-4-dehydro-6-deoxy-D-mannose reductase